MIREREYSVGEEISKEKTPLSNVFVRKTSYDISPITQVPAQYENLKVKRILSAALDVFSDLPSSVYNNDHAKKFLECLRDKIANYDSSEINGIVLSKLQVSEVSEKVLVIEWIYNYFRFYYAFNKLDGDYRGFVVNNPENDRFTNDVRKMNPEDFDSLAEEDLTYVVMMTEGETDGLSG